MVTLSHLASEEPLQAGSSVLLTTPFLVGLCCSGSIPVLEGAISPKGPSLICSFVCWLIYINSDENVAHQLSDLGFITLS